LLALFRFLRPELPHFDEGPRRLELIPGHNGGGIGPDLDDADQLGGVQRVRIDHRAEFADRFAHDLAQPLAFTPRNQLERALHAL